MRKYLLPLLLIVALLGLHLWSLLRIPAPFVDESSLFGYLALDRSELERILAKYATQTAEFNSGIFGETRLYRFAWGD
jgi:hypothetical protein